MGSTTRLKPVHPGEILREEYLKPLGMSTNALAIALRIPVSRVKAIVGGKRSITADVALRLARYFDTTPDYWINLQSGYDIRVFREG
jgi:addiction module HigA family antidote